MWWYVPLALVYQKNAVASETLAGYSKDRYLTELRRSMR
jgi:hypothetical protein